MSGSAAWASTASASAFTSTFSARRGGFDGSGSGIVAAGRRT
jgi:hypothetical protein